MLQNMFIATEDFLLCNYYYSLSNEMHENNRQQMIICLWRYTVI